MCDLCHFFDVVKKPEWNHLFFRWFKKTNCDFQHQKTINMNKNTIKKKIYKIIVRNIVKRKDTFRSKINTWSDKRFLSFSSKTHRLEFFMYLTINLVLFLVFYFHFWTSISICFLRHPNSNPLSSFFSTLLLLLSQLLLPFQRIIVAI